MIQPWVRRMTVAVSALFAGCAAQPPAEEELPVEIRLYNPLQTENRTPFFSPLNTDCEHATADELTHRDMNKKLMAQIFVEQESSPQEIQAKAKTDFEKRRAFFEKLFGCRPGNEEINQTARKLKENRNDFSSRLKLMDLLLIEHYADIAAFYDPAFFQKQAKEIAAKKIQPYVEGFKNAGIVPDSNFMDDVDFHIKKNYALLLKTRLNIDVDNLFGIPNEVGKPTEDTFEEFTETLVEEAIKKTLKAIEDKIKAERRSDKMPLAPIPAEPRRSL